jgi:hypothetical protein
MSLNKTNNQLEEVKNDQKQINTSSQLKKRSNDAEDLTLTESPNNLVSNHSILAIIFRTDSIISAFTARH